MDFGAGDYFLEPLKARALLFERAFDYDYKRTMMPPMRVDRSSLMFSNKSAAGNSHRPCQFDQFMKFGHHHCSQAQSPVAVPELGRSATMHTSP
jgi:hypothetical protein